MQLRFRLAVEDDAEALCAIYSYYVNNTAVSFEWVAPTAEEFRERIRRTLLSYPYIVAEVDGSVAGYIYAGRLGVRKAFDWSAEISVYIGEAYHRLGLGRRLYEKLEAILRLQRVVGAYAAIAVPRVEDDPYLTRRSEQFHEAMGYRTVATYHSCGYKFGRWYDKIDMEKELNAPGCPQADFVPFPKLPADIVSAILLAND